MTEPGALPVHWRDEHLTTPLSFARHEDAESTQVRDSGPKDRHSAERSWEVQDLSSNVAKHFCGQLGGLVAVPLQMTTGGHDLYRIPVPPMRRRHHFVPLPAHSTYESGIDEKLTKRLI